MTRPTREEVARAISGWSYEPHDGPATQATWGRYLLQAERAAALFPKEQEQVAGYQRELRECEQVAGKALGYPWFKDDQANFPGTTEVDGVCIGEHVGATIVEELASALSAARMRILEQAQALRAAGAALDVADRLIERGYGMDTPQEWNDAFRSVADLNSALLSSAQGETNPTAEVPA